MVDYGRYRYIKVERENRVALLTLNRPEVLNAMNMELHAELEDIFVDVASDDEVNVVVLTGAGRAFCAGGGIKAMGERLTDPRARVPLAGARRLIHNMLEVEQPIIAALNGDAVGLGALASPISATSSMPLKMPELVTLTSWWGLWPETGVQ